MAPSKIRDDPIITKPIFLYTDGVSLTLVLFELPVGKAELVLGPLKVPLQCGDLCSTSGGGQQ